MPRPRPRPSFPRATRRVAVPALLALLPLIAAPAAAPLEAQAPGAPPPCTSPDHRAFDFWIGQWDVFNPAGRQVGRNEIRAVLGGCVLHEDYSTAQGFTGESFNTWSAARGVWHQTWVDNSGTLLLLEGGLEGDAMVLRGRSAGPGGSPALERITWTPLDGGRVRQHWERSTDEGDSWTTVFDGEYRPRSGDGSGR